MLGSGIRRRSAFTLIELLVVIAIIGTLIALLLPAIQQAREAARRTQCRNNLKQLGIALHQYHDQFNVFPAAAHGGFAHVYFNFTGYASLLPFLEQESLSSQFNYDVSFWSGTGGYFGWSHPANTSAYGTVLNVYLCPSNRGEPAAPFVYFSFGTENWRVERPAVTDYVFSAGATPFISAAFTDPSRRGIFGFDSRIRMGDVIDGTAKTFLVGEAAGGNQANPTRAIGFGTSRVCVPRNTPLGSATTVHYDNLMYMGFGRPRGISTTATIIGGLVGSTVDRSGFVYPLNDCGYHSQTDAFAGPAPQQVPNFRSVHAGMVQFVMADGSVQTVSESINPVLLQGLSTIAGSETVADGANSLAGE